MSARYETFADRNLAVVSRNGDEYMVRCPIHNESNASMQFNVQTGLFICFGCGEGGSIKTLEKWLGIRAQEDAIDVSDIYAKLDALKNPEAEVLPVLDEGFLSRYKFPTRYWEGRGFEPKTVAAFDLGYDPVGDFMGSYATIPIRNVNGGLLGVIRRYMDPDAELRYRYPKGFKRSENLFASWMVANDPDAHTVVLTEGSLDAIKVWQAGYPAMAIYGSSLSRTQLRLIRRLGITKAILFYDNDKAGWKATRSSVGVRERKRMDPKTRKRITVQEYDPQTDLARDCVVTLARYRDGGPTDPGDMSAKQIRRAIETARNLDLAKVRKDVAV